MGKHKIGDKFVVEIDGASNDKEPFYRFKGIDSFCVSESALDTLTQANEFQEIYGVYTDKEIADKEAAAHIAGLSEAWDAARKIMLPTDYRGFTLSELQNIFGSQESYFILKDYSATEAIKKISDYKKKKEKMFCPGDVIQNKDQPEIIAVVMFADSEDHFDAIKLSESDEYGEKYGIYYKRDVSFWKKTGQHYNLDEIFKLVQGEGDE